MLFSIQNAGPYTSVDRTNCPTLTVERSGTQYTVTGCSEICKELQKLNQQFRESSRFEHGQVSGITLYGTLMPSVVIISQKVENNLAT